jgi:ParB family chromosome partitioning protein
MTTRKKPVLGRNLSSMLSKNTLKKVESEAGDQLRQLPVDQVRRGAYQPRMVFDQDKLDALAASIKAQGIVQPIVVRRAGDDSSREAHYELIAGERRWRAAQIAGLESIPAVISDVADEAVVAMALIENIQREDLNPLEEAGALKRLVDDFDLTHQQAADSIGRSRVAVSNLLRLLELMQEVKDMVDSRLIQMGHARALLSLEDSLQVSAAREVVRKRLSVRDTESLVRRLKQGDNKRVRPIIDPDIQRLQNSLETALCARVNIKHTKTGKGKLVINYNSSDELDGILERFNLPAD